MAGDQLRWADQDSEGSDLDPWAAFGLDVIGHGVLFLNRVIPRYEVYTAELSSYTMKSWQDLVHPGIRDLVNGVLLGGNAPSPAKSENSASKRRKLLANTSPGTDAD